MAWLLSSLLLLAVSQCCTSFQSAVLMTLCQQLRLLYSFGGCQSSSTPRGRCSARAERFCLRGLRTSHGRPERRRAMRQSRMLLQTRRPLSSRAGKNSSLTSAITVTNKQRLLTSHTQAGGYLRFRKIVIMTAIIAVVKFQTMRGTEEPGYQIAARFLGPSLDI